MSASNWIDKGFTYLELAYVKNIQIPLRTRRLEKHHQKHPHFADCARLIFEDRSPGNKTLERNIKQEYNIRRVARDAYFLKTSLAIATKRCAELRYVLAPTDQNKDDMRRPDLDRLKNDHYKLYNICP